MEVHTLKMMCENVSEGEFFESTHMWFVCVLAAGYHRCPEGLQAAIPHVVSISTLGVWVFLLLLFRPYLCHMAVLLAPALLQHLLYEG